MDAMNWTQELEQALSNISELKEAPTDEIFVSQVRLELLATKALQLRDLLKQPISAAKVFLDAKALLAQAQNLRQASHCPSQVQPREQSTSPFNILRLQAD
jgi:hypothetical protein